MPEDLAITLRLEKKGSMYTAWYSTGGGNLEFLGSTDMILSDIRAGLIACDGGVAPEGDMVALMMGINAADAAKPFKVMFDYFNIGNRGN